MAERTLELALTDEENDRLTDVADDRLVARLSRTCLTLRGEQASGR
jgi:hypothetical protein